MLTADSLATPPTALGRKHAAIRLMIGIALAFDAAFDVVWIIRTPAVDIVAAFGRAVGCAHAHAVLVLGAGVGIGAAAV